MWSILSCLVIQFNFCKHFFCSCVVHKILCGKCRGGFLGFHYVILFMFALYHSLGIWTPKRPRNLECQIIKKKITKTTQEEKGSISTLETLTRQIIIATLLVAIGVAPCHHRHYGGWFLLNNNRAKGASIPFSCVFIVVSLCVQKEEQFWQKKEDSGGKSWAPSPLQPFYRVFIFSQTLKVWYNWEVWVPWHHA